MSGMYIMGTGHALPEHRIDNQWFAQQMDTTEDWITSRTGIQTRRHCTTETHTQLCIQAAEQAIQKAGIAPEEIGVCIVATVSPDYLTPSTACLVGRGVGLKEDTLCFDLNGACTGFLYALHTAECLLATAPKKYALIIGGEVLSRLLDFTDRSTCILFGDGAGAVVGGWSQDYMPMHTQVGYRGDDSMLTIAGANTGVPSTIQMAGTAVFKFAVEVVPKCINEVLNLAGCTVEEVDFFVFHQANARIIDLVVRNYGIPQEKYYKNIQNYGNTSAASIPIVLSELAEEGRISKGSRILCVGFGGGLTWGGALITFG